MHFNGADCIQYLLAGVGVVTIRISQNHAEGLFFIENFQLSSFCSSLKNIMHTGIRGEKLQK